MDEPILMLTTKDNPWNPFTNFDEWDAWDKTHGWHIENDRIALGYYTNGYLARIATDSADISPAQSQREVNNAIREIVDFNLTGMHVAVKETDYKNWVPQSN